uniref:Acetylglutamate kinase n=1 Tax=uncultured prokaryote TaxID=198431 RepID=H5SKB1_9ZZZZ|nr:acetylglutamate kinase [uncultured prokaryote]
MLVVKIGGGAALNLEAICADIARLVAWDEQVVVVHGGSGEMDLISERLGRPARIVTSPSGVQSRYTDRETMEIFTMVVAGRVNKMLVERLQQKGVNALGLSGLDGRLLEGKRKGTIIAVENGRKKVLRDDYGGTVERVNVPLLHLLLAQGFTPVVAPVAISEEGEALNVDGDRVAAAIAGALRARALVILSGVPGLLRDFPDERTVIPSIPGDQVGMYQEYARGKMKKKLLGAEEALRHGVRRVILADGRGEQPVLRALAEGNGTVIWATTSERPPHPSPAACGGFPLPSPDLWSGEGRGLGGGVRTPLP